MNEKMSGLLEKVKSLDQVEIIQTLHSDTSIHNKNKDKNHRHSGKVELRFSALKGLVALGVGLVGIFSLVLMFKKCVEKKLLRKLEKDYVLLPIDRCELIGEDDEEE